VRERIGAGIPGKAGTGRMREWETKKRLKRKTYLKHKFSFVRIEEM